MQRLTHFTDWIAHGIMDSIVDSFFPFLEEIEQEIINIENLIFSDDHLRLNDPDLQQIPLEPQVSNPDTLVSKESFTEREKLPLSPSLQEKNERRSSYRMQFSVPKRHLLSLRRIKQLIRRSARLVSQVQLHPSSPRKDDPTPTMVHRVAHVRRLVTSLSRFLATKSEVVAQVKKRILMTGEHGLGNGTGDDRDVFVYMGDVQGISWKPLHCKFVA